LLNANRKGNTTNSLKKISILNSELHSKRVKINTEGKKGGRIAKPKQDWLRESKRIDGKSYWSAWPDLELFLKKGIKL